MSTRADEGVTRLIFPPRSVKLSGISSATGGTMAEWEYAESNPSDELAQLSFFSVKTRQPGGVVEFVITVKEFATPRDHSLKFFASADKQTNQKTVPCTPCGWGDTLLKALAECIVAIHRFPYEGA
jgi:hypothetical protein